MERTAAPPAFRKICGRRTAAPLSACFSLTPVMPPSLSSWSQVSALQDCSDPQTHGDQLCACDRVSNDQPYELHSGQPACESHRMVIPAFVCVDPRDAVFVICDLH